MSEHDDTGDDIADGCFKWAVWMLVLIGILKLANVI